ncbi:hypothetical protein DFP72DRAFT_841401 [Ephemerocybe angulata]|uniref:Uncharacterized protein n=1 Tax=Ephemerocybe angulata TaxID=980116 RepID=A0A8H6IF30_9AGAR|nr:hypothetical protein DFP72DRAFT_841401 [Tulosesus angulatus]
MTNPQVLLLVSLMISLLSATSVCAVPTPTVSARSVTSVDLTNAQRLARGLTPNIPKRLFDPTRVRRNPLPSPQPNVVGKIAIKSASNNDPIGWLAVNLRELTHDPQIITFKNPASASELLELDLADNSGRHLGLQVDDENAHIGAGHNAYATVTFTHTSTGAGQSVSPDSDSSNQFVETTVWSVDPTTGRLTAQWVNKDDGSVAPLFFVLDTYRGGSRLWFFGDRDAFTWNSDYHEVTYWIEPA